MLKGIDISSHQHTRKTQAGDILINWGKLAKNIDFVIIRTGYGNSSNQVDSQFYDHMEAAIRAGIKRIGVYHFSYSRSAEEAKTEANVAMYLCQRYKQYISFIAYDWEYDSHDYCVNNGIIPTRALCDRMAAAFKSEVEKEGYRFMLYTNPDYASRYFTLTKYSCLWIAQYASACSVKDVDVWQYTSKGHLPGYGGNLDEDICYNDKLFFDWEEKRMATNYIKGDDCIGALAVKEMLLKLHKYGAIKTKVDENGIVGGGTVEAVKECQKLTGRKQTGEITEADVKAIAKLVDKYAPKPDPLNGDVNGDGKVNMEDVTALQKKIAGIK